MAYQHAMETYAVLTESNTYAREEYLSLLKSYEDGESGNGAGPGTQQLFAEFREYLRDAFAANSGAGEDGKNALKLTAYFLGNVDEQKITI